MLVRALALSAIFIIDYAQTIIISSLTALLVPTRAENESNTRLWAASLFLLLQIAVYLPTLLVALVALPASLSLLNVDAATSALITPLVYLAFFALLREAIIVALWQRVKAELSTSPMELDAITHAAV
jgi:hypothetical protein